MVKVQKPIPKNLGNKPKLNNPIKEKKQKLKKEKSSITEKVKLLEDSTPVKEAKVALKSGEEIIAKKKHKKELKDAAKKPIVAVPAPEPSEHQNGKAKKVKPGKEKNVASNGLKQDEEKSSKDPEKKKKKKKGTEVEIEQAEAPVLEKPAKKSKKIKEPAVKEVPAPVEAAPPKKSKHATAKEAVEPPKKPGKAAKAPKADKTSSDAPQKKSAKSVPIPESKPAAKEGKSGKKQKNKKNKASEPETEAVPSLEKIKKPQKPTIALQEKKKAKIAFKKSKLSSKAGKHQTEQKPKAGTTFRYDPIPYDEERFHAIVNVENIKKIAEALKTTVEKEVKAKKSMIFDDYRYFLEAASFKIPSCPKRMVKLTLKHSLVGKDDDVLLVVPDLKRGGKVDYEPTKHHYEDLLRQNGVKGITVMPMNQLRREYQTFESKRRLCASYEHFMCDGRIVGHVGALVGKFTQKPRSTFHAVRLNENKDIKAEIEKSLKKTAFRQLAKSSLQSIPVGTHKFSSDQLAENIEHVVTQLKTVLPGGLGNIRSLHLKIGLTGTSSLPLYISMGQAPDETPMVIGPREERLAKLKREANEVLANFSMTKEGKLVKLTKPAAEKKRKLIEMKAALTEEEKEEAESAKSAKKMKKNKAENEKKTKKSKEVKDLELPENEEEEDDDTGDEDDDEEDVIQLGQGSDDETEDDDMANVEDEDAESGAEIVENGFVGEDDEESEEDDEQEVDQNDNNEDDDDDDEDDDNDEEDDDEEESD